MEPQQALQTGLRIVAAMPARASDRVHGEDVGFYALFSQIQILPWTHSREFNDLLLWKAMLTVHVDIVGAPVLFYFFRFTKTITR
jgi:hypothetical protein